LSDQWKGNSNKCASRPQNQLNFSRKLRQTIFEFPTENEGKERGNLLFYSLLNGI